MVEEIEIVVVGAGPAGLRAAEVLAAGGREVVVLEKNDAIGPKTCAGGLTRKTVHELEGLGLPADAGCPLLAHASFQTKGTLPLDPELAVVRTLARRTLGELQAGWARAAGAEVRSGAAVSRLDLGERTLEVGGRRLRYRHLIGADGTRSAVRRALGLRSQRDFYAAEYNLPGVRLEQLLVACDSAALGSGYFWIFPHTDYTSIGAGASKTIVPPARIRPYLEEKLSELGLEAGATRYEGATIEIEFAGFDFPGDVHLVGDAAGVASGLTAEGIYPALVTGEETARRILEPGCASPKTRTWLRTKRIHDVIGRFWLGRRARDLSFALLPSLCRRRRTRRWLSSLFVMG